MHSHSTIPATSGIYRITCAVTGKIYIGSAVNLRRRWIDHRKHLRNNTHDNEKLQRAWNKYGGDAFTFEIIEFVLIPELLTTREQYWLDKVKPFGNKGLNMAKIAGSSLGIKRSPETREKLSALKRGKPGKTHTPEERERIRQRMRGNTHMIGKKFSPEHRAKISTALIGNKINLGRKLSSEHRAKIGAANLGKKRTRKT